MTVGVLVFGQCVHSSVIDSPSFSTFRGNAHQSNVTYDMTSDEACDFIV